MAIQSEITLKNYKGKKKEYDFQLLGCGEADRLFVIGDTQHKLVIV
jgi:hypothetical protein